MLMGLVDDGVNLNTIIGAMQTLAIIGGGAIFFMKAGRSAGRVEELLKVHHDDILNLQQDLKNLQPVLTTIAVQKEQIQNLVKWYDELRHGQGFIKAA